MAGLMISANLLGKHAPKKFPAASRAQKSTKIDEHSRKIMTHHENKIKIKEIANIEETTRTSTQINDNQRKLTIIS